MKKRIYAVFTVLIMIFSLVPMGAFAENSAQKAILKIHYNRPDGDYEGWNVWLWPDGQGGNSYNFAEENGEMVATAEIPAGVTKFGFIIRLNDWEAKDFDADQFIDVAEMVSGTVHIKVESGVEGFTKEYDDDVVKGVKLVSARYDGDVTIDTVFTGKIEEDLNTYFSVSNADGNVEIAKVEAKSDTKYVITLAKKLDLTKEYTLTSNGAASKLSMPGIFSTKDFEDNYTYSGNDLGATYTKEKTTFRVWAPTADAVKVNIFTAGVSTVSDLEESIDLTSDVNGTWVAEKTGDLNGKYYTYTVKIGETENEAGDPYARSAGLNGVRSMIIDLDATDPENWDKDSDPNADKTFNDAIIYELHIRDLSVSENSGITNKGKFLGLTETGTKSPSGVATGLDHMKELGITHLHILPMYDFGSVDESKSDGFNWGYDPVNYNVPEGSYSTDPSNGETRVKEVKQMVQALHNNGISVIMDVVYNHVYNADEFCFNKIVPKYFSRVSDTGKFSNGSGCGNDTATERSMVKKYIVDSVNYWADEYHIDGFRFDLVGLMDTELINEIVETVHKNHPNVVFYGEGWKLDTEMTKSGYDLAVQGNSDKTPNFAFFNDTIRDGLRGNVFDTADAGFVAGNSTYTDSIKQSYLGFDIPYYLGKWCSNPSQNVNYASCHDNNTLIDRITISSPDATREEQVKMNNLAAAIYLTAQGIPFMQAGEEMLRTKVKEDGTFEHNSYKSGDEVNMLRWENLDNDEYKNVFEYYKGLISFRKAHPALRLTNADDVSKSVSTVEGTPANTAAFNIKGGVNGEPSDALYVIFNANKDAVEFDLPEGTWNVCVEGDKAGTEVLRTVEGGQKVSVAGISSMVLTQGKNSEVTSNSSAVTGDSNTSDAKPSSFPVVPVAAGSAAVVVGGIIAAVAIHKKKS